MMDSRRDGKEKEAIDVASSRKIAIFAKLIEERAAAMLIGVPAVATSAAASAAETSAEKSRTETLIGASEAVTLVGMSFVTTIEWSIGESADPKSRTSAVQASAAEKKKDKKRCFDVIDFKRENVRDARCKMAHKLQFSH